MFDTIRHLDELLRSSGQPQHLQVHQPFKSQLESSKGGKGQFCCTIAHDLFTQLANGHEWLHASFAA